MRDRLILAATLLFQVRTTGFAQVAQSWQRALQRLRDDTRPSRQLHTLRPTPAQPGVP